MATTNLHVAKFAVHTQLLNVDVPPSFSLSLYFSSFQPMLHTHMLRDCEPWLGLARVHDTPDCV
eukprot:6442012-Amphidinium_carterae.4